jgi:alpha-L-rhamnosidase
MKRPLIFPSWLAFSANHLLVFFNVFFIFFFSIEVLSQDFYTGKRQTWLQKAENLKPKLSESEKKPLYIVTLTKDESAFQSWKAVKSDPMDSLYKSSFKKKSGIVVDFGEHLTGYYSFTITPWGGTPDGPLRFKFTFGEMPAELTANYDSFPDGLSRAWIQDEVITVMNLPERPSVITISRRMAFRYLKVELLGSSRYFDFSISDMNFKAVTSVTNMPSPLANTSEQLIKDIDRVGYITLKECMQTVYEDGPKRDSRLWIGDLYLESLANAYSFRNHKLTQRCLYLLAGLSADNGYLNANVFESPEPHPQKNSLLFDYCLLYNVALKEYLSATDDKETAMDLWPVAKKQIEISRKYIKDGIFDYQAAGKELWLFVDWKEDLDKQVPEQGLIIFALARTYELAKMLGKENEIAEIPDLIRRMKDAARKKFLDKNTGLFLSGPEKQISYASQAWMVLAGVTSAEEGRKAINALASAQGVVHPGAPYLFHYYIDAMIQCGLHKEAKASIVNYWGGMVKKGADTFWEVYDPKNDFLSPYNFYPLNSYCHAWSCTPVYFIRKYPEIFQK